MMLLKLSVVSVFYVALFLAVFVLTTKGNGDIISSITLDPELILYVDPPDGHSSPAALGVFARANDPTALVYYDEFGKNPFLNSTFLTYSTPYIQLDTPFKASRNRTLSVVAVMTDETGAKTRSEQYILHYFVEGTARPSSYGFLVPGTESGGYFVRFGIEIAATARAQVAGGQEFADFFTNLGIGTYATQISALHLISLDPDLQGFEGGFPGECYLHKIFIRAYCISVSDPVESLECSTINVDSI